MYHKYLVAGSMLYLVAAIYEGLYGLVGSHDYVSSPFSFDCSRGLSRFDEWSH